MAKTSEQLHAEHMRKMLKWAEEGPDIEIQFTEEIKMEITKQLEAGHEIVFRIAEGCEAFADEFTSLLLVNPESREDWLDTEPEDIGVLGQYFVWRINKAGGTKFKLTDWSRTFTSGKVATVLGISKVVDTPEVFDRPKAPKMRKILRGKSD